MFTWTVVQGQAAKLPIVVSACPLTTASVMAASVSTGLTDAALVTFTPTFAASGPPNVVLSMTSAQTATLQPGAYVCHVRLASNSGEIAFGVVQVVAAPGYTPTYDVLATPAQAILLNPELANGPEGPGKVAALPFMLQKATETIRRHCNRVFTRRTYTEYLSPSLEGEIMLREMPINKVTRIQRTPTTAITITADPATYQVAYVDYSSVDLALPNPYDVAYTGIVLNAFSSGVASNVPILFAGLTTINDLAAAVDAVSGWKATVAGNYGLLPVSELYCDGNSQGALDDGMQICVFAEDVSESRLDRRTGLIQMPRYGRNFGPPFNWSFLGWDDQYDVTCDDLVRVTYDAGFTVVPAVIQEAAVELAKVYFDRSDVDYAVKKESTGYYSYELNENISLSIPDPIRQDLAPYRIHHA
jgi:hypothetical protein